jgi:multiple sugar transport system permease protein
MTIAEPLPRPAARRFRLGEKERFMLLLVAPAASVLIMFQVVPILIGANASFRHWPLYDPSGEWLGLEHYIRVLRTRCSWGWCCPTRCS